MSVRHLVFSLVAVAGMVSCIGNSTDKKDTPLSDSLKKAATTDSANFTSIEWIDSTRDFGKVQEGPDVDIVYRFKNVGDKPLVITDVVPGCGCTVADKPTAPIMPGNEGTIKGVFTTKGHVGVNNKHITVQANTKPVQSFDLKFSIEVLKGS